MPSVIEHVAGILAWSRPYGVKVSAVLSGAKHEAAARRRVAEETAVTSDSASLRGPASPGSHREEAQAESR